MSDPVLKCPDCGTSIKLNESLAGPLLERARAEFNQKLRRKNDEITAEKTRLENERSMMDVKLKRGIEDARAGIATEESKKAREKAAKDLAAQAKEAENLRAALKENDQKLAKAQDEQAQFLKQRRVLEDEKRELGLTIEKRVQEEADQIRAKAKAEQESVYHLKQKESDHMIAALTKQIGDLKRRAEQGSQQHQGEVLEIELEDLLARKFPYDEIKPVPKGEFGGDIIQNVMSPNGKICGSILWETKRTKSWHATWLPKIKNDQRKAGAAIAILMSTALPQEFETAQFKQIDGVWVTGYESAISLVTVLRNGLIDIASAYAVRDGQESKAELIYDYLTGTKFKHRVEAIVEKFELMHKDLHQERKVMTKLWARREQQIQGVIASTIGMYGDLEGIAGTSMPAIDGLDMPLLEED